jgi:antitoxin ParD1/3/4
MSSQSSPARPTWRWPRQSRRVARRGACLLSLSRSPRNTSVTLGEHFEAFIARQIKAGRFESKSEVVRAAMRLLEEHEKKVATLSKALVVGRTPS